MPAKTPQTVTITAACPDCDTDATWHGTCTEPGQATAYTITCPRCDGWTVPAQVARHRTIPDRPANPLLRMLQRALDRRAA
jgi:hypothetical protein